MISLFRIYASTDCSAIRTESPLVIMAVGRDGQLRCVGTGAEPQEVAARTPEGFLGFERVDADGKRYTELVVGQ